MAHSLALENFEAHRGYLMRLATRRLRDRSLAEDVVQDTLLAAWHGAASYCGASSARTWLTAILKHKMVDAIRRNVRDRALAACASNIDSDEGDGEFDRAGNWVSPPSEWSDPEAALSNRQFHAVLRTCIDQLPPRMARVFTMREIMQLDTEEICRELAITPNNLWVQLHRARVALREMLERRWFQAPAHL